MTAGETLHEGEEGMGEAGMVMDSDLLASIEEGVRGRSVGVVAVSEGAAGLQDRAEVDTARAEVCGSACEGSGVGVVSVGEVGREVAEEGTGNRVLAGGEEGKGEVMRGIGEEGWGEKGKAGD